MEKVFDIIENIKKNTTIIITVAFTEKYNISIGKDDNSITIYFFNMKENGILKITGNPIGTNYSLMKKYLLDKIDDTPFNYISGLSSIENIDELNKNFTIKSDQNHIIELYKKF